MIRYQMWSLLGTKVSKKVFKICSTRRKTSYSQNSYEGAYCPVSIYLAI